MYSTNSGAPPAHELGTAHRRGRIVDICVLLVLLLGSFAVIARVGLPPADPRGGVAVVYAPWVSPAEAMQRSVGAGARFVQFGAFPFVAIVAPDAPDYIDRAFADRALLVLDPAMLAACIGFISGTSRTS